MSKYKNDPTKDVLDTAFLELIIEINNMMLSAEKRVKLPSYKELGIRLSEKVNRPCKKPYSDKEIFTLMNSNHYTPDRRAKQYVKRRVVITDSYMYPPTFVYVKLNTPKEQDDLIYWCKANLPNDFVDAMRTDEGLLLIAKSEQFPYNFASKYEKAALELGIKYKLEKE